MTNNFTPKKSGTAARPQLSPEEYAAKKKAEKDAVYQMIDDTAAEIVSDPDKFRAYLDTQARMDRYSVANALLIYKQQPQATQLKDFRDWQEDGVKVNKGAKSLSILEPVEYAKNDGSTGIAYNVKKVFDVAQTSGKKPAAPTLDRDPRKLVAIMLDTAPIDVTTVEELPSPNMGAFYKNEDQTLYIKRDIGDSVALCQCVAQELGHAQLAMNCEAYSRRDMGFSAVCVGYMLCRKFGVDVKNFAIDRIPEELAGKSPKEIRAELSKTRSGAGKTRFYCKPNLMQANTSFVILDPKGEIVRDVGNLLEKKGYEIRVLDLISMEKSHCYNPFVYLHSDNDVQRLVTNLFKSTTPKGSQSNDPFWDTSASMLLSALVYYLHYEAPEDEQNFAMVMEMLQAAAIDNEEDPRPSPLDCLFADLELDRPDHIALKYYRSYHTGSAKTLKSIQITLAARLEKFNLGSLAALTCTDELDLASMGEKKVALFAIIPDNDSSFNFLVSILYTQLFQQLFFSADHIHGGALPIPVHFLMDEFANVSLPDDFDKILSVMRSRGVFVSIILQNLAQLKALFEKQWESIVGNCDEFLYLGGNEQSTHKYVSELLGKETIDTNTYGKSSGRSGNYSTNYQISGRELLTPDEVRMLDNRYAILFIRGELPVMDLKYDILKHPAVDLTADGKGGVYQHGKVTSNVATIEVQYLDPDTMPDTEVSETTYELLSDEDFNSETTNNTTTKLRR